MGGGLAVMMTYNYSQNVVHVFSVKISSLGHYSSGRVPNSSGIFRHNVGARAGHYHDVLHTSHITSATGLELVHHANVKVRVGGYSAMREHTASSRVQIMPAHAQ